MFHMLNVHILKTANVLNYSFNFTCFCVYSSYHSILQMFIDLECYSSVLVFFMLLLLLFNSDLPMSVYIKLYTEYQLYHAWAL